MRKNSLAALLFLFGFTMLIILLLAVGVLIYSMEKKRDIWLSPAVEYQYVYVTDSADSDSGSQGTTEASCWILREFEGQIGVFEPDGTLIQIIETYVKTLPKADRSMLEEGIYARSKQELRDLIEAYSD